MCVYVCRGKYQASRSNWKITITQFHKCMDYWEAKVKLEDILEDVYIQFKLEAMITLITILCQNSIKQVANILHKHMPLH